MQGDRARAFMQAIFRTEESEIDCSRFLDVVSRYVDSEVGGADPLLIEPGFAHHTGLCTDCAELYQALLSVADLEASGQLPLTDALWEELATLAGTPPAKPDNAAQPRTTVAPALVDDPVRASSWSIARIRQAVGGTPRRTVFATAGGLTVVALAAGVWTAGRLRMEGEYAPFVTIAATATELRTAEMPGGGMLRVLYSPDSETFVVGTEPVASGTGRMKYWLIGEDGERHLVEYSGRIKGKRMWVAQADAPLAEYVALAITSESGGTPMAQVGLR